MTAATLSAPAQSPTGGRPRPRSSMWALAAICTVAAVLYAWKIGAGQWGNVYYSAAVKSMTGSFTNFLFGSFDPYGVVTVDKPPMALWPQAVSALIFGYHGWALLLPQVIEGVAAVFLLHRTVRRWAGEKAALLAALILALTPITVAINRDNNPDTLLVLLLVAAAYAFTRSVQAIPDGARTRWLLLCAFLVGCGFLTKMLQAWIIVPAIALAYLVGTTISIRRRILDLLAAGAVLLASSFWWVALHAWWPGDKPYIGGSTDGSAWDLIIGYNGLGRVFGGDGNFGAGGGGGPSARTGLPAGFAPPSGGGFAPSGGGSAFFGEAPGLTRMFNSSVGGQISWLLPLALLVLVVVAVTGVLRMRAKKPGDAVERAGWFFWGGWLLVTAVVFSYAEGIWHPYYTTMLAPAIAALCGAGLVRFWQSYRRAESIGRLLLPVAIAITAVWAFVLASRSPSWHGWTRWAVVAVAAVAVVGLVIGYLSPRRRRLLGRPALVAGIIAVLLVPAVWSTAAAATPGSGTTRAAGPSADSGGARGRSAGNAPGGMAPPSGMPSGAFPGMNQGQPPGGARGPAGPRGMGGSGGELTDEQRRIVDYAVAHGVGAAIALAVNESAMGVAGYIMGSDETVIGMGGFGGTDNAPSVDQLARWVQDGELRFILSGSGGMGGRGGMGGNHRQERHEWIEQHCDAVDPSAYGGPPGLGQPGGGRAGRGAQTLYYCDA